jgi:hypothetical protein
MCFNGWIKCTSSLKDKAVYVLTVNPRPFGLFFGGVIRINEAIIALKGKKKLNK